MIPNPLKPITIIIVDDHRLVRTGLARMIGDEIDMCIIAEAATGEEAIQMCETQLPDIVLLAQEMAGSVLKRFGIALESEVRLIWT